MSQSIEGAQQTITEALQGMHANRKIIENEEALMYPPYAEAYTKMRHALQDLPSGITCVSIQASFARVIPSKRHEYPGWAGSQLLTLQQYLGQLNEELQTQDPLEYEFVVKPNSYPEELKHLSHGSRVRDLATQIYETLRLDYEGNHFLSIKPYGAPEGIDGLWARDAKPFRVPIQVVAGIRLHTEQKPLTPYLESPRANDFRVVPVTY